MSDENRTTLLDRVTALAAVCVSIFVIWSVVTAKAVESSKKGLVEDVEGRDLTLSLKDAHLEGVAQAHLVIAEFSDFECPFCGRHALETLPSLRRDYVETGKIRYAFLSFPLESIHPSALKAARAAECAASQAKFWEMHDWLFANRASLALINISDQARPLGLDGDQFGTCLRTSEATIRSQIAEAGRLEVKSTPTFLVGRLKSDDSIAVSRRINGAAPYETFKQTLDELLNEKPSIMSRLRGLLN